MSEKEASREPLYYIGVVAKMLEVHPQALRHYERLGLVQPHRSEGNVRLYSPYDVERLRKICRLSDELGVNLAGIEVILNLLDRVEQLQQEMHRLEAEYQAAMQRLGERLRELESDS